MCHMNTRCYDEVTGAGVMLCMLRLAYPLDEVVEPKGDEHRGPVADYHAKDPASQQVGSTGADE